MKFWPVAGRNRPLAVLPPILAAGVVCALSAVADVGQGDFSPEGFSESHEGLLESAIDSWSATVLVESRHLMLDESGRPVWRTKRASGVIVRLSDEETVAVIATTAHAISSQEKTCSIRVAFDDLEASNRQKWSACVHVVSCNTAKDLAFIEADIPTGSNARTAKFASAECEDPGLDRVVSIGWPQLMIRQEWGVKPPPNYQDRVKRYSDGLFLSLLRGYRMRSDATGLVNRLNVINHNADVLPGSSGGPLVNRNGEVVGINAMVVCAVGEPNYHRYCAQRGIEESGDCIHVAIASMEVIDEHEHVYGSRLALTGCVQ